jgi:hypothetical protein
MDEHLFLPIMPAGPPVLGLCHKNRLGRERFPAGRI